MIFSMILRVESTSPPGVLSSINKAWSLRRVCFVDGSGDIFLRDGLHRIVDDDLQDLRDATHPSTRSAARPRRIRAMLFMSRRPPSRIFLLLFADRGRNFLLALARTTLFGMQAVPPGKIRTARDKPGAALVCEIGPRPLGKNQHSVLETD